MGDKQFCAQISRDAGDPLIGTAARADIWLLIEYTAAWGRNEIESSSLPLAVKDWIEQARRFNTRTRLIKRGGSRDKAITVFVAVTLEQRQTLYRFQLERYEDLLALDLEAMRDGQSRYEPYRYDAPLFLVCTHGKHDACCAKFGLPVYNELERLAGEHTWQSSHVGGDKFAANVVCFPNGIYYGRVAVSEVKDIIASTFQSQIYMAKYRGRSCYMPVVQAGEFFLRDRTGKNDVAAFRLLETQQVQEDQWWVCFASQEDGAQHCLLLQERVREASPYYTTCHAGKKSISKSYHLRYYEMFGPGQAHHHPRIQFVSSST